MNTRQSQTSCVFSLLFKLLVISQSQLNYPVITRKQALPSRRQINYPVIPRYSSLKQSVYKESGTKFLCDFHFPLLSSGFIFEFNINDPINAFSVCGLRAMTPMRRAALVVPARRHGCNVNQQSSMYHPASHTRLSCRSPEEAVFISVTSSA